MLTCQQNDDFQLEISTKHSAERKGKQGKQVVHLLKHAVSLPVTPDIRADDSNLYSPLGLRQSYNYSFLTSNIFLKF